MEACCFPSGSQWGIIWFWRRHFGWWQRITLPQMSRVLGLWIHLYTSVHLPFGDCFPSLGWCSFDGATSHGTYSLIQIGSTSPGWVQFWSPTSMAMWLGTDTRDKSGQILTWGYILQIHSCMRAWELAGYSCSIVCNSKDRYHLNIHQ